MAEDDTPKFTAIPGGREEPKRKGQRTPEEAGCKGCLVSTLELPNAPQVADVMDRCYRSAMGWRDTHREIEPLMEGWPEDDKLTEKNVEDHLKKHSPIDARRTRHWLETAKKEGLDITNLPVFVRFMVSEIGEHFFQGKLMPATLTEATNFLRFAVALERDQTEEVGAEAMRQQFRFLLAAVEKHIPPELWAKVMGEVGVQTRGKPTPALEPARELVKDVGPSVVQTLEAEVEAKPRRKHTRAKDEDEDW